VIKTSFKFHGSKITLAGYGFRKYQMARLGQIAVAALKARVARGVGSDDAPMGALAERYRRQKQQYGLNPIRDLRGPGQTTYMKRTYGSGGRRYVMTASGARSFTMSRATIRFRSEGGGAHMLDNFTVRYADENAVRMDITAQWARDRARSNERRSPWFGFSPNDVRVILVAARQMFHMNITDFAAKFRGVSGSAVWMDPFGLTGQTVRKVA
jgi:hypothetical protein